ncbi:MAG TPA: hypothetical protein ENJ86_11535 [Methylothermaceae bacterium]|nr:hypothetical protein [Methylothermaceae bacterium]
MRAAAQGRWPEILARLGIDASHLKNRHGPCPGCGGQDRFRFDDLEGRGTWVCGGGGQEQAGDGFQLLEHVHGWNRAESFKAVAETLGLADGMDPPPPRKAPAKPPGSDRRARQAEAAKLACAVIDAAPLAEISHPYLIAKQLPCQRDEQTPANPFPTLYQIPIKGLVELIGYHPKGRAGHLDGNILIAPVGDWEGIHHPGND